MLHRLSEAKVDTERQRRDQLSESDTVGMALHAITVPPSEKPSEDDDEFSSGGARSMILVSIDDLVERSPASKPQADVQQCRPK
jgi:hypothetical protein